jgi:hypothetical protein
MSQAAVIRKLFKNNHEALATVESGESGHKLLLDVEWFNVGEDEIEFSGEDFPYLRAALLDRHLEEIENESS